jgi:DNA-binding CsgD family transcriptional regulator/PAS domain-containing protein
MPEAETPEAEFLAQLIGQIYDAALDQGLWPGALEQICQFVQGPAAMIYCQDVALRTGKRFHSWGDDPEYTRQYFERYIALNPIVTTQHFSEVGEVKTAHDLIPYDELVETRFYQEWMRPQGYVDNIFANLEKSATSYAAFAVSRDTHSGPADREARRRMRILTPHMRRAVVIGNVIDLYKVEATMLADTLAGVASGVFVVGANACIVFANPAGRDMLGEGTILREAQGALVAVKPQADGALQEVIAAAGRGDAELGGRGVAIALADPQSERWLAHVLPLTSGARRQAGITCSAVAAVFVRNASLYTLSSMEILSELYGLTASEVRVLQAVVEIGGVPAVARALGISAATVKTHLHHVFAKTGTVRQADLVKLVAGHASPFKR